MVSQKFTKTERVRKRREYLTIQRKGEKVHLQHLLAFIKKNSSSCRRVGITVSKKVGKAVVRNRIKRILREAWRTHKNFFPVGFDIVLVAKKNAHELNLKELCEELALLAKRLEKRYSTA